MFLVRSFPPAALPTDKTCEKPVALHAMGNRSSFITNRLLVDCMSMNLKNVSDVNNEIAKEASAFQ